MNLSLLVAAIFAVYPTLIISGSPTSEPPTLDSAAAPPLTPAEQLSVAIQENDLDSLEKLLRHDPTLARLNNRDHAPLLEALRSRRKEAASILISYGAEVEVFAAAGLGDVDQLKVFLDGDLSLLDARSIFGDTLLETAAKADQLSTAKLLIARGAIAIAKKRTCQSQRSGPEFSAVSAEMIDLILRNGGDPNANPCGISLLARAIGSRNRELVKAILDAGADVNGQVRSCSFNNMAGSIVGQENSFNCSPLHYAVWKADESVVSVLLAYKAKVNAIDSRGQTPLDAAIERRRTQIATVLRLNGGTAAVETGVK